MSVRVEVYNSATTGIMSDVPGAFNIHTDRAVRPVFIEVFQINVGAVLLNAWSSPHDF
jgi:hypothetical protein